MCLKNNCVDFIRIGAFMLIVSSRYSLCKRSVLEFSDV